MSEPVPIRPGVQPTIDLEREMLEWCQIQIRAFIRDHGTAPSRVGMALMGGSGREDPLKTLVNSWDIYNRASTLEVCATSAMLLTRMAVSSCE